LKELSVKSKQSIRFLPPFPSLSRIVCAHDFDNLRRRIEKNRQQPISMVIVDVHVHKLFRITDFIAAL